MRILFKLIIISSIMIGCSGVRQVEQAVNSGDFDRAIDLSVRRLINNKNAKRNQDYVLLLETAFAKAVEQDQIVLNRLESDPNPNTLESIYQILDNMQHRQDKIRPLLPLKINKTGSHAQFNIQDYSTKIVQARTKLSEFLLNRARLGLDQANKLQARQLFDDLQYLQSINPDYRDAAALSNRALELGTDYILVSLANNTQQIIPQRLEDELLNFSTYGLNDRWTVYHNNSIDNLDYDYDLNIEFMNINISPEQVLQKELHKEQQVKDGFEYELDDRGNVRKDSLGNDIKRDKFKLVKAIITQNTQFKEVSIDANLLLIDRISGQQIDRFPIASSFVFEYIYGSVQGDRRAIDRDYLQTLNPRAIPFPTNEQMVYDAGEDLKLKVKEVLTGLILRR